jgi:hypothetical protein
MNQDKHFFTMHPVFFRLWAGLAAATFVLAGCSDVTTSSSEPDVRFVLDSPTDAPVAAAANSTASAAGGPGVVVVIGRIVLPNGCYALSPRAERTGQSLELAVVAQPTGATCVAVVTSRGYTLRVGSLPSGTYHVRLTHEIQGPPLIELVLEKDVHVD